MQLKDGEKLSIIGGRAISEEQSIFAGHGFPVLATLMAKKLYHPDIRVCFESGAIYSNPKHIPHSVSDTINYQSSDFPLDLPDAFAMLERRDIKAVSLSGAQVDRRGNINSTLIRCEDGIKRLPGSGGACDFASLGEVEYIFMLHEPRRLLERVDYITSPGLQTSPSKKIRLITNYGIFAIEEEGVKAIALEDKVDS